MSETGETVLRRAPFATNPAVGARGQRAQQRIVEAGLRVFAEVGYHECGIGRITELSGCSRASFYQYFSGKEDLFRHLAGRVARELAAATDTLGPITGDRAGWEALHGWFARYGRLYDAYEPVFTTFQSAVASDEAVATGSAKVAVRTFDGIRSRITGAALAPRAVDGVVRALLDAIARANRVAALLDRAGLGDGAAARDRVEVALADVFHRTLFGVDAAVNVHPPPGGEGAGSGPVAVPPVPAFAAGPGDGATPGAAVAGGQAAGADGADPGDEVGGSERRDGEGPLGPAGRETRARLIEAGHRVFAERGYYATRVADVVEAAGVSHGVFYRYFANKTELFRILAGRASRRLAATLADIPPPPGPPACGGDEARGGDEAGAGAELRAWLRRYATTSAEEAAITAMWSEAMSRDETLGTASTAAIETFRAMCARYLAPRGFGDRDAEAIVLLVLLDALVATPRRPVSPARIDAVARLIERGLVTPP
ncbi:MAG TPA: TetR/AcrR family transcriptional regulator [Acidimicrobiales bacterium]